jgi:hypothetical protein
MLLTATGLAGFIATSLERVGRLVMFKKRPFNHLFLGKKKISLIFIVKWKLVLTVDLLYTQLLNTYKSQKKKNF